MTTDDGLMKKDYKTQRLDNLLFAIGKKMFWVLLGILLMFAIIRYILI